VYYIVIIQQLCSDMQSVDREAFGSARHQLKYIDEQCQVAGSKGGFV